MCYGILDYGTAWYGSEEYCVVKYGVTLYCEAKYFMLEYDMAWSMGCSSMVCCKLLESCLTEMAECHIGL